MPHIRCEIKNAFHHALCQNEQMRRTSRGRCAQASLATVILIASAVLFGHAAHADPLQDYAQQCDAAIGATVQDFDCDAGTVVPVTHFNGSTCDRPNRLDKVCDPGSRFQVLMQNADAYIVGLCRKKGDAAGQYGDIAVIQYGRKNGATCFYQALDTGLPGHVSAPSKGQGAWPWKSPSETAGIGCGGCHDNGPFIRSPYLNQVTGPNALPGANDSSFNSSEPYAFVGQDFASWKAYSVEIAGNECISCHRLGVNNVRSDSGTALDFGIRATSASEPSKNSPSKDSPIWMPPGPPTQVAFSQAHASAAKAIHDCAARLNETPLPNTDACRITLFAEAYVASELLQYTGQPCSGESCPGWQILDNNPASVRIAAAVDRLYQLHDSGRIWQYTGQPCSGGSCPGWQMLDNDERTGRIAAGEGRLYQIPTAGSRVSRVRTCVECRLH